MVCRRFEPERAVEIVGPTYGSGYRIGGRLVLTAVHLFPAGVGSACQIRSRPTFETVTATVAWTAPGADIALVALPDTVVGCEPVAFGVLPTGPEKVRFDLYGWPKWARTTRSDKPPKAGGRHIDGQIYLADTSPEGLLVLEPTRVPETPAPDEAGSDWEGLSGAAVVCDGLVVAVQHHHQNPRRPASLEAEPLAKVHSDEGWRSLLEKEGIASLLEQLMPWTRHLKALRDSEQITPSVYDETLRLIEGSLVTQGHLQQRDQAWLAEIDLTVKNVPVQQALAALSYGIDARLQLFNIDFSLIPPGRIHGAYKNQQPFYLSQVAFTARALSALPFANGDAFSVIASASGLCLANAEKIIKDLNECLYQAVSTDIPSLEANVGLDLGESDLYWFRLPAVRELEFAAALKGSAASQRCQKEADLTATGRHPLRIAGLVGGLWQFCTGENPGDHFVWGGTLHLSSSEFSQGVPTIHCYNSLLAAPGYALRIVVEPFSRPRT